MDGQGISQIIETAERATLKPTVLRGPGYHLLCQPALSADGALSYAYGELALPTCAPAPLALHTLSGLSKYIIDNREALDDSVAMVHVVSPHRVDYIFPASGVEGSTPERPCYAIAEWIPVFQPDPGTDSFFRFGSYTDPESFNVALQTLFAPSPERTALLAVVGNVRAEGLTSFTDDGVSQAVAAGTGVKLGKLVELPNPITLRPWRTFRDVEQPTSRFVLRARNGGGNLPLLALYEAEGGQWKLEAIQSIAAYLRAALPDTISVIA